LDLVKAQQLLADGQQELFEWRHPNQLQCKFKETQNILLVNKKFYLNKF
jgi:hypothetical protein